MIIYYAWIFFFWSNFIWDPFRVLHSVCGKVREHFYFGNALYNPKKENDFFLEKILVNCEQNLNPQTIRELKKAVYSYKLINIKYKKDAQDLYIINASRNLEIASNCKTVQEFTEETRKKEAALAPLKKEIMKMQYQLNGLRLMLEQVWGLTFRKDFNQPLYTKKNNNPYFNKSIYNTGQSLINVVSDKVYVELCPKALFRFNPSFNLMYNIIYEEKETKPTRVSEFTNINILVVI